MNKIKSSIPDEKSIAQRSGTFTLFSKKPLALAVASAICLPVMAQQITANAQEATASGQTEQSAQSVGPAQKNAAGQPKTETVVVSGIRSSLQKAQDIKRNSDQMVDAIVADDIGKLPDANVAEALQRVSGVQVSRDRGEGDKIQIRGLSQTETLLNGRPIFTAGKERGVSFQDIPAELLAGVNVYKTPSADQVEGGIGGIVDLRTRRPFDFSDSKVAATVKVSEGDYAKKQNADASVLLSKRWQTSIGEMGALISISHQNRDYRADTLELGAPAQLADGSGLYAPTAAWTAYELGSRDRTGVSGAFQYRPSQALELYSDWSYTHLKTKTNTYGFFGSPFWANYNASTNSGQLFQNGKIASSNGQFQKGSFWGASMSTTSAIGDEDTTTKQLALGGTWKSGDWRINTELSRTNSDFSRLYQEARLGAWTNSGSYTFDLNTPTPKAYPVLGNAGDLSDPSHYWADKAVYFNQQNTAHETAWKIDARKSLEQGWLSDLRSGFRWSDRRATSAEINTLDNMFSNSASGPVAGATSALAAQIGMIPLNNLLAAAPTGTFPTQWLGLTNLDWLRNSQVSRAAMGLTVPAIDPRQRFDYAESTSAAYAMADFETSLWGKNASGNVGVRFVNTRIDRSYVPFAVTSQSGAVTVVNNSSGAVSSIHSNDTYVLPSFNLRLDLSDKLVGRLAASKVVTQPDFDQLTPSLSLNANDKTGYLGNPALKALTAEQLDTSLEYYLSDSDHVYGAAFYKKIDGFIQTSTVNLNYSDGNTYTVSTPSNGEDGRVLGTEVGYQTFFKNLPGVFKGLGLQTNYTYVDSSAPGVLAGQKTALQGLSRNSYNIIGMYDYSNLSFRLAYTYRDKYLSGTQNYYPANGSQIAQTPVYMAGYGILDAYLSYAITPHVKLAVEGSNLTRTVRRSYFGVNNLPKGVYVDDRRFALSLHIDL